MKNGRKQKGFTLAELLIVVAIIAVLVAISIPIFAALLEKSRETTDFANVRSAYAEVMASALSESTEHKQADGNYQIVVKLNQAKDGWDSDISDIAIGGVSSDNSEQWIGTPKANGNCSVTIDTSSSLAIINWDASGGSSEPPAGGTLSNSDNAESIYTVIHDKVFKNADLNIANSISVEVYVYSDGTINFSYNNPHNTDTVALQAAIINQLKTEGYLDADGKVVFDKSDDKYPNGYHFKVINNNAGGNGHGNGNGNKPHIEAIE